MKPQTFQELGKGSLIIPSVINLSKKKKKNIPALLFCQLYAALYKWDKAVVAKEEKTT